MDWKSPGMDSHLNCFYRFGETGKSRLSKYVLLIELILLLPGFGYSDELTNRDASNQLGKRTSLSTDGLQDYNPVQFCVNNFTWIAQEDVSVTENKSRQMFQQLLQANCELKSRLEQMEMKIAWMIPFIDKIRDSEQELFHAAPKPSVNEGSSKSPSQNGTNEIIINNREWKIPPLFSAIHPNKNVSLDIIKKMIDNGADVFSKDPGTNMTFLHKFISEPTILTPSQFHDIVAFLVSRNFSSLFNVPGGDRDATPLMLAVQYIEVEKASLSILHENGVNFNALDDTGDSTLKYAIGGNRTVSCLSELIEFGADWKIINKVKFNMIHIASYYGHLEGIKLFVRKGLDINAADIHGITPLHLVCLRGTADSIVETVRFMVEHGANTKAMNRYNQTTTDYLNWNEKIYQIPVHNELKKLLSHNNRS